MKDAEKKNLLKWNTLLWIFAMIVPGVFSIAFASTKFPWQIVVPFLLFGCLLGSNRMLSQAMEPYTGDSGSASRDR
jgi:hypothetical protein